ncbi:MAG: hypothetical protein JWO89_3174 [Verrucomicrobiaceae bacterium]|nr:hypothetical protein [Verrucomicrobiaceae bacterium]MDB6119515.1 hypothetical protein [Verrucomicrobiaceae bacterium]
MNTKEELIEWLRDAYAMERGLEVTLQKMADTEDALPEFRERARQHKEETTGHAEDVKACLEQLGADTSTLKTTLAEGMEMVKGLGTSFAKDERVKDVLAGYASEHFEIACYTALLTAGARLQLPAVTEMCTKIIGEEQAMADWFDDHLPDVVGAYLKEADA